MACIAGANEHLQELVKRRGRLLVCLCAALLLAGMPLRGGEPLRGGAPMRGGELLSGKALVTALRAGGFNIYFRHAETDWSRDDHVEKEGDWTSCDPSRIRQLAPEGRLTAREMGRAMRALGIPVGKVLSSEYCRAAETARLLGLGKVKTTREIMNMRAAEFVGGRDAVIRRAQGQLAIKPAPGTNTVLVAHGNLVRDATGTYPGEAGAAVFAPDGKGGFRLVATLTPADWAALASRYGSGRMHPM
jgi:broad specificity phosphatase PhoE